MKNYDEILAATDGIMVARGDVSKKYGRGRIFSTKWDLRLTKYLFPTLIFGSLEWRSHPKRVSLHKR